jgi:hypothetical protein
MATLAQLVKGFRANVRNGIPTTLYFSGKDVSLSTNDNKGIVGMTTRPGVMQRNKCYRVWFEGGTATLQDARSPEQARVLIRGRGIPDRITKVENLSS